MNDRERNGTEPLWTAEDVAAFLGVHVQTVYQKALRGEIPSVKIGAARRFVPSAIRDMVARAAEAAGVAR